jgi:superfamily II DNA or RNA helicase
MRRLLLISTTLAKALQAGERWVTVHPHGPDSKGQPILIQEQKDGSAKVIGGAGGKLNHLRLTGIKPQSDYAETLKQRAKERREVAQRQSQRDKALGLQKSKAEAQAKVAEAKRDAQREFVKGVAQAMGWSGEDIAFDEAKTENLPEHVANRLRERHLSDLVKRAQAAVNLNRERLLTDHSATAEAQLGEIPLDTTDPEALSVRDVSPVSVTPVGLGFAADYKGRAEAAGADVKAEAKEFSKGLTDAQRKAAIAAGETARMVKEAMETLRDPDQVDALAPKLVDAKAALDLLKLDKKRRLAEANAKKARKEIAASEIAPAKAYVIESDDAQVDAKVAEEVAADLRTVSTRAFLSEVAKHSPDPQKELARYVGTGAYNSVNSLALAAGGAGLVDRSVVDVLGIGGAAQVLARRLQTDLTAAEYQAVVEGMQDFHLHHYVEASDEAISRARELAEQAAEIQLGEAEHGNDLAALQEINMRRSAALAEANKVLGTALGEMEANAALVYALGQGRSDKPFEVALGQVSMESAIAQVRAIGLQRGDYTIESAGGTRVLKVKPDGLDRLAQPVNREDLEQVRRNISIMRGDEDQDGWMPEGIVDRADLDHDAKPGAAPQLAQPFEPGEDLETSIRDYIGGRAADGDAPADIVADLQSLPFMQRVGDRGEEYRGLLDKLAPLDDGDGKLRPADALRDSFDEMADAFVQARYGVERTPIHRQAFDAEGVGVEALHRALAAVPEGVAAYKPVGELTPQDQSALREVFARNVAKESPDARETRHQLEGLEANEPERHIEDMFGEQATNPEWAQWREQRDQLRERVNAGTTTWPKYVEAMRAPERAYAAMQDLVRSDVNEAFSRHYNTLNPDAPLKLGRAVIRENLNHLDATDPAARQARQEREAGLRDTLRNRAQGRYAAGAVSDKLDAAREEEAGLSAAQMGLFGGEPAEADRDAAPLAPDERHYLGHVAERQIASLMPKVGANFRPGEPVKLFRPTMSGGKNWPRQRAVKMLDANKRVVLSFGTGSGKTLIGLGGYTHLHSQGKVKRGLFLVPSISQGGFQAESLRFLDPKKGYRWHAKPGADFHDRLAAYKDPANNFCVMTHQSFRDDMLHLGAQHAGTTPEKLAEQLAGLPREQRRDWIKGVMEKEGISFDYLNLDEGQDALNRQGKENSNLANVVDALGDHVPYYVNASADPIKNDVSEAFDLLSKMDSASYTDRAAFMRKYGVDTLAAKDGLRRELARFQFPSKIDPDVTAHRSEVRVPVTNGQKKTIAALESNLAKARLARLQGKVDVEACKALSPSAFEGVPDAEHEAVAREISKNLGLVKASAMRRALEGADGGADVDEVVRQAGMRKGKQGIVFAHSLHAVEALKARLAAEGYRVESITGKDTAKDKARKIDAFNPQAGESKADIMVASDAGAVGANLQSGRWLVNFDTPDTAKTHAQRNGRINRIGQTQDVDLVDLVRDHPEEQRRRDRLKRKYALRDALTTPMESLDDTGVAGFLRRRSVAQENGDLDLAA